MTARRFACAIALLSASCGRTALREPSDGGSRADASDARDAGPDSPTPNACGGNLPLAGEPRTECAACSRWRCDGTDAVRCEAFATVNACGVCGPLPEEECNGRDDDCDGQIDEGCVRRLTTLRQTVSHPRISGERVGFDLGGRSSNASDAVVAVLPAGDSQFLSPHSDPPGLGTDPSQESEATIEGHWMAWITRRVDPLWNGGRLIGFDLETGRMETVSDRRSNHPSIEASGRVVFESPGASDYEWDIWLGDVRGGAARALTGREGDEHWPEISGDRVVFTRGTGDSPVFNRQIVVRDLRTGGERIVSEGLDGFQTEPAIDGDLVVWRQQVGDSAPSRVGFIWLFDLGSGERRRIDTTGVGYEPRVSGSLVCWSTLSSEPGGLTVFDVVTGRSRVFSREGHHCDVDGRRVVWVEGLSTTDVYFRDLLPDEP